jgi:hypothetical protein
MAANSWFSQVIYRNFIFWIRESNTRLAAASQPRKPDISNFLDNQDCPRLGGLIPSAILSIEKDKMNSNKCQKFGFKPREGTKKRMYWQGKREGCFASQSRW